MSIFKKTIQERLKKNQVIPKRQISVSIKDEHVEKLDAIAKTLSHYSGRSTTRNMLIEDAIEAYIDEAVKSFEEDGIAMISSPPPDDYDTVVFPAHYDGFNQTFLNENKWRYARVKKDRIPNIKYVAIYVGTPLSKITHYAKVANFVRAADGGKYEILFDGAAIELEKHVPLGSASPASTRAPRYTTLQKLLTAENYKDL